MGKFDAYGTILQIGDGGGTEVFANVASIRTISGPGLSLDTVDVTTHDSPSAFREFVATLLDAGEVTLELVWDPDTATHVALRADLAARVDARNFKVIFPDATNTTWLFAAIVTAYQPSAPVDGDLTASVTLKVDGAPTLA